jgi:hypothetical protein
MTLMGPFLLIGAFLLIGVACDETSPERVDDTGDDTAVESVSDDDNDVAESTDDATDDASDVVATDDVNDDVATDDSDDVATDDTEEATEPGDTDDGELEEAEGFTVGDTVRMGDLVMRFHSVRWDEGSEFMGPDDGMRWLIADIEIENESDSATSISSLLMFDLVDEENRTRDMAFGANTEGSMDGELGAGRSMRGDLAFEVRDDQAAWELIFTPQLFGFGQAIFDITLDDFDS